VMCLRLHVRHQVLLDCNHPLAGAPLTFTLTLLELERGAGA
jgi:FKBP-type peptidyl-prolyl cis-trans isomerase 2